MAVSIAIFVSKRAQRMAAAFMLLTLAQIVAVSCTPEPVMPYAVRAVIER
ncbi:hypothetical protein OVA03_02580 [Asticcacaulis sp. SL142]|jgi:hypothetical protein|nr:hypothetical protein OVA03_02580 [Asticcacaulis sp. SL142]